MNRIVWTTLLIGLIVFLVFIPDFFMYSGYGIMDFIVFGLIAGLAPFLVYKTVDSFGTERNDYSIHIKHNWKYILALLAPVVLGTSFGFFHEKQGMEELKRAGRWTTGVVQYRSDSKTGKTIFCRYIVQGEEIEVNFTDVSRKYNTGDTIKIIYSPEWPRLSESEDNFKNE